MSKDVYLVTGGGGFIGSFICEKLLAENNHVICVDNFITGQRKNIAHLLSNPNFRLIETDVSKPSWPLTLSPYPLALDFILHLASPAGPNPKSPKSYHALPVETYLVNSIGTHYLLELAKKHNAVFLFASTSEIYGDPEIHPQPETYWGHVNPIGPRAIYDESKRLGEAICAAWSRKFGVQTRIARIFNTYGPRMNPDDGRAIPLFIQSSINHQPLTIHGDGHQTRSFCYVDDQVEGLLKLLHSDANADPINIGNSTEISILDLVKTIIRLTDSKSTIKFDKLPEDDPERRRPDISKANKKLGWKPKIGLEEGLMKTIAYFGTLNVVR
ncbi:GDP-mannose 4,6-dehydratase [Candidatus Collierbacteria bacterium]|nr:GDP-mannose 4,6-dehydratase [Candidatus Collierbacteria bacterium]